MNRGRRLQMPQPLLYPLLAGGVADSPTLCLDEKTLDKVGRKEKRGYNTKNLREETRHPYELCHPAS